MRSVAPRMKDNEHQIVFHDDLTRCLHHRACCGVGSLVTARLPYSGPFRPTMPLDPIAASPGFFRARFVRKGPDVPAKLWFREERDEETGDLLADVQYFAEVWLEPTSPFEPQGWPWTPIEEPEFRYLVDLLRYSLKHKPTAPICFPYLPAYTAPREFI